MPARRRGKDANWSYCQKMSDMEFILTPSGYQEIQNELADLVTIKRPAIIERIRQARQLGEPCENMDYDDAKRSQALLESRIIELRAIISHASIMEGTSADGAVAVGSTVTVKNLPRGARDTYTIVGPAESDPGEGKISLESRVGEALLGKKAGDDVVFKTPVGARKLEIVSVA